jgi:hypothetical protein
MESLRLHGIERRGLASIELGEVGALVHDPRDEYAEESHRTGSFGPLDRRRIGAVDRPYRVFVFDPDPERLESTVVLLGPLKGFPDFESDSEKVVRQR